MSKAEGKEPLSISHAKELFSAVTDSYNNKLRNRLLLVKGTKFGTTKGNIKAGADGDFWEVTELTGSVDLGFSFVLKRVV